MKNILLFFIILCLASPLNAKITASVNRSVITEGQSIELRITSDVKKDGSPNFNILSDNFVLGGQSSLQNTSIINGKMETRYSAGINLIPFKTGDIIIPALTWDGEKTQPLTLIVNPASTKANDTDLFIQSEISPQTVYEGQEVIYTVSIFDRSGLTDGNFIPPSLKNAEVQEIQDLPLTTVQKNGKSYHKFSRQYVLFPQEPGTFSIEPASFRGHVFQEKQKTSNDVFSSFGLDPSIIYSNLSSQQKEVYVRSTPLTLTVKERPSFMSGKWWLPSTKVSMEETFTPAQNEVKAGEAITRTIVVRARGVLGTKIPDLTMTDTPSFKVYPGQSKKENYVDDKGLIGIMEQSFILVPIQNGEMRINPLSISWFNVKTNTEVQSSVPGKTFKIFGSEASSSPQNISVPPEDTTSDSSLFKKEPSLYSQENNWLFFIAGASLGFFFSLLLFFIFIILIHPHRHLKKKKQIANLYPEHKTQKKDF